MGLGRLRLQQWPPQVDHYQASHYDCQTQTTDVCYNFCKPSKTTAAFCPASSMATQVSYARPRASQASYARPRTSQASCGRSRASKASCGRSMASKYSGARSRASQASCSELYVRLEEASPLIEDIVVRADEALN